MPQAYQTIQTIPEIPVPSKIILFPQVSEEVSLSPSERRIQGKRPTDAVETRVEAGSDSIKNEAHIAALLEATLGRDNFKDKRLGIQIVIGMNLGLRIGDLVKLRWKDLYEAAVEDTGIPERWALRNPIIIKEEKSSKNRALYPNEALGLALQWFKAYEASRRPLGLDINEYLFIGDSNFKRFTANDAPGAIKKMVQCPLYESNVRDAMRDLIKECRINYRVTPHSLRKTFGYFIGQLAGEEEQYSNRSTSIVQKIFNHSDQRVTLRYIGMDVVEISGYYQDLNLGLESVKRHCR